MDAVFDHNKIILTIWTCFFYTPTQDLDSGGLKKVELSNTLFLLSFMIVKKKNQGVKSSATGTVMCAIKHQNMSSKKCRETQL